MKISLILVFIQLIVININAQKYACRTGEVSFFSTTIQEDIDAKTKEAIIVLDTVTGKVYAKMLIKLFMFKKKLMQDHFNENYLESDKYPYGILDAKIIEPIPYYRDGIYNVSLEGVMEIHGVRKPVKIDAVIEVKEGIISTKTEFMVKLKDYKIDIPKIVIKLIAEEIKVNVSGVFAPFNQR